MAREMRKKGCEYKRGGKVRRAEGGRTNKESMIDPKVEFDGQTEDTYAGQQSNVRKEAKGEARKHGGMVKKHVMSEGDKPKERLDRKRRATGGRVGADERPLSTAAKERPASDSYRRPQ